MASSRDGAIQLVRGKEIVKIDGAALRQEASTFERVIIDLGAGDGRFAYRLARAHPAWLCLAIDANADGMLERSYRAGRKPSRGGIPNVRFIRAALERLPAALDGIADEIYVLFPWGGLLKAVLLPAPETLGRIARLGRPGAAFKVRANASALHDAGLVAKGTSSVQLEVGLRARLVTSYAAAGLKIVTYRAGPDDIRSSWSRRLNHGRVSPVVAIDGVIE